MYSDLYKILPAETIKLNELMKEHTTFQIGGPVDIMIFPQNVGQVAKTTKWCHENNIPLFILGLGSNLLVREKGIRGAAIKIGAGLKQVIFKDNEIYAEAGISLSDLAKLAANNSLSGLEFAEGIPGSLGGAVVMNAGAYNGEMKDVIKEVIVVDADGNLISINNPDMHFAYRQSILQNSSYIVTAVCLQLTPGNRPEIEMRMADLALQRKSKQPLEMPSAGSTFRRPTGFYVGPMLEQLGLKGFSIGGAQVSTKHAGFIVNKGGATADDVLQLVAYIQAKVKEAFNVNLHTEILVVGEE